MHWGPGSDRKKGNKSKNRKRESETSQLKVWEFSKNFEDKKYTQFPNDNVVAVSNKLPF